ncbi:MAG: hypothetical protein Q9226_002949 [Calogaya cf. arnoldii]
MKFMTFLATGILPMLALAGPIADASPVAVGEADAMPIAEPVEVAKPDVPPTSPVDARDLLKRSTQYCRIIRDDGPVKCRDGPGTSYGYRCTMAPGGGETWPVLSVSLQCVGTAKVGNEGERWLSVLSVGGNEILKRCGGRTA